jgi:preprotein translocase subunit SecD
MTGPAMSCARFRGRSGEDAWVRCARVVCRAAVAVATGLLLVAASACSSSGAAPASTVPSAALVGKGALNFQLRPVLQMTSAKSAHCPTSIDTTPNPKRPTVACSIDHQYRFALGPAFLTGQDVTAATPVQVPGTSTWTVHVELTETGRATVLVATTSLASHKPPRNKVAIMVDGFVVSAVNVTGPVSGSVEVSGGLTQQQAQVIAQRIVATS